MGIAVHEYWKQHCLNKLQVKYEFPIYFPFKWHDGILR